MTDYYEKAAEYVREHCGDHFAVVESGVIDKEDLYCFTYQTKAFLETGDFRTMTVGQGPQIIVKQDNRIFSFGSGLTGYDAMKELRQQLAKEARIRTHTPDFTLKQKYGIQITMIKKPHLLFEKLRSLPITYTVPEPIGDAIYRTQKNYTKKLLEQRLSELPVPFRQIGEPVSTIYELLISDTCEFDIVKLKPRNFAKYLTGATDDDLQTIW